MPINDFDTMNENISEYLLKYMKNPDPQYAVMIKGKWGCGKSFFIKNWLDNYKERYNTGKVALEPIYVSLYGLKEISQITSAIDRTLHPYLYSKGAKLTKEILKTAGKIVFRTSIDCNNDGKEDLSMDATIDSLSLLVSKGSNQIIKSKLIVFDDLERCLIDIKLILGYINNFVEHGACHVIIIGDETHTTDVAKNELDKFKEKTVGREFEIKPDIYAAIDSFIKNDVLEKDKIIKYRQFIFDCFRATKCNNLRILRQCLYDFSTLYTEVSTELIDNNHFFMMSLLGKYIITYCEYRGEFRDILKGGKWGYWSNICNDVKKEQIEKFQNKYVSIINRYKVDIFDVDCIKKIINEIETGYGLNSYVEGLLNQKLGNVSIQDKLADFTNLSNDEFEKEYAKLEVELRENNVTSLYLIGRSLALLIFFDNNQIHTIPEDIIPTIKNYIINRYKSIDNKELLCQEHAAFYRGLKSYECNSENPIGAGVSNFVIETFDKRNSELKNKMEEILLTLNDSNIEKLIELSDESSPGGMCKYKQTSIFKNIDAGVFANNILHLSNKSLYPLCMFISHHYEFCSNIYSAHYNYNDDLITLQQVNDIIENEIQNRTCVDRYMLRYFLKYLSGAIKRANGENNQIKID